MVNLLDNYIIMKILVLHGYGQTPTETLISWLKTIYTSKKATRFKENVEKYLIIDDDEYFLPNGFLKLDSGYGWFEKEKVDFDTKTNKANQEDINNIINSDIIGDFDLVIAFSQGCFTATVLLDNNRITTKKLILFCPVFIHDHHIKNKIIPTTLIYRGSNDTLASYPESNYYDFMFENVEYKTHPTGHVIPSDAESKKIVKKFIN